MPDLNSNGKLYLCGTPIGNLEDMTFRAIRILKESNYIACEDTRQTIKLLNHFEIKTKMISYHQHNEEKCSEYLINEILNGKNVALVSDAGMPVISDPGMIIIKKAIQQDIEIIPIPGPSAFLMSLVVSGFNIENFTYYGFIPNKTKDKNLFFEKVKRSNNVSVIYESPHRLLNTLNDIKQNLGEIKICVGKEISKKYENFFRKDVSECIDYFSKVEIKGEFCIVIDAYHQDIKIDISDINNEIKQLINSGISKKEISKIISKKFNIPSKEIYNQLISENKN